MADLSVTANSVVINASAVFMETAFAGEAITAGKAVYLASATKKWMLADNNSGTAEARVAKGIALNGAAANQPVTIAKPGAVINIGATLTAGATYFLSDTAGGVCPDADVGSGETVCIVGVAISTSEMKLMMTAPGVVR